MLTVIPLHEGKPKGPLHFPHFAGNGICGFVLSHSAASPIATFCPIQMIPNYLCKRAHNLTSR